MDSVLKRAREELGDRVVHTLLDPRVSQGQKLKLLRELRGLSAKQLGHASGVSDTFIRFVEQGKRRIGRRDMALKLDRGLRAGGYLALGLGFLPEWSWKDWSEPEGEVDAA
jgi:transcriptional regulator with XRE-family HTH domain